MRQDRIRAALGAVPGVQPDAAQAWNLHFDGPIDLLRPRDDDVRRAGDDVRRAHTGKGDARLLADRAVPPVAADQVAGAHPVRALRSAYLDGHCLLVLGQPDELVPTPYLDAEFPCAFLQHLLQTLLRYAQAIHGIGVQFG